MASLIPPVILKASTRHTATMIFLHGLGDTGFGWSGALNTIRPSYMKVICPTAPMIPVTLNAGMQMPAWYDIRSLDPHDSHREDMDGVEIAYKNLKGLVDSEIKGPITRDRIIIGGFSQGGAIALYTALKEPSLGGCVALSTYLAGGKLPVDPSSTSKCTTPLLQCHGEADEMVPFVRGQQSFEAAGEIIQDKNFHSFPNMGHEASPEEMELVKNFINKYVPPLAADP